MTLKPESASQHGVLTPSVPLDIGRRTQRQRILVAMAASCAKKSYAETTIADIVGHASISRATFYKHFANKRECFAATADKFVDELGGAAVVARSQEDSHLAVIHAMVGAVLDQLAAKPDHARLLLVEAPYVDLTIIGRCRDRVTRAFASGVRSAEAQSDPGIAFGRAELLIADYIAAGKADQLPSLRQELVYIALLPCFGHETALAEAGFGK